MNEVPKVRPMSKMDIERRAESFLKQHSPRTLSHHERFDIETFTDVDLERYYGFYLYYDDNITDRVFGYTDCINKKVVISGRHSKKVELNRATIAHETGHVVMHSGQIARVFKNIPQKQQEALMYRAQDIKPFENPEWQAWWFAGAILMPRYAVRKIINNGGDTNDVANNFGVSYSFASARIDRINRL